jgi:hypothetical protein
MQIKRFARAQSALTGLFVGLLALTSVSVIPSQPEATAFVGTQGASRKTATSLDVAAVEVH